MRYSALTIMVAALVTASSAAMAQGRACDRLYREYLNAEGPKAWAAAPGGCGYASARSSSNLADARRRAIDYCSESARGCRIQEEERR